MLLEICFLDLPTKLILTSPSLNATAIVIRWNRNKTLTTISPSHMIEITRNSSDLNSSKVVNIKARLGYENTHMFNDLLPGTEYTFVVREKIDTHFGEYSNVLSRTTPQTGILSFVFFLYSFGMVIHVIMKCLS